MDRHSTTSPIRVLLVYLVGQSLTQNRPYLLDPFDRIRVSQALLEEMLLLSADPQISRYPVEVVWQDRFT